MAYVPMKEILEKNKNIYKLVLLASKRAMELSEGAHPLTPVRETANKPTTTALKEITEGKVFIKAEKEEKEAKAKKSKK